MSSGAAGHGHLFLEGFGQLSRPNNIPGTGSGSEGLNEDLYGIFGARADLMGWSTTPGKSSSPHMPQPLMHPVLWWMHEAEFASGGAPFRIGYVQVGLEPNVDPVMALPALIQCMDDALGRFGAVELSGLQLTARFLQPGTGSCAWDLMSGRNWFNLAAKARASVLIAFDNELLRGRPEAELVAENLRRMNNGSFEFGSVVDVPEEHAIEVPVEAPHRYVSSPVHSGLGISVTLPEWTASAAAWVLALVIDTARVQKPDVCDFTVRLSRVQ